MGKALRARRIQEIIKILDNDIIIDKSNFIPLKRDTEGVGVYNQTRDADKNIVD